MKMAFRFLSILFLLHFLAPSFLPAQDLTGIWRGHFRSNEGARRTNGGDSNILENYRLYDDRYKIEVQIAQTHNRFEAVTFSYKSTEFYGKANATGTLNPQTKKVLLKENKLLEVRVAYGYVCVMTCFMQYSRLGKDEYLQGTYYSVSSGDSSIDCGKGSIFLHRVTESDFEVEPFLAEKEKEKELLARKKSAAAPEKPAQPLAVAPAVKPPPPTVKKAAPKSSPVAKKPELKPVSPPVAASRKPESVVIRPNIVPKDSSVKIAEPLPPVPIPDVLKTRTNELLKTITVGNSSIELRIYDDGAIDNDTVSVYYDNKLLISHARLSDQPITVRINVDPSEHPHQLVMVAENLGDIPPNTSLLVVRDGEKRYEERIISNEQKNIVINFQYKKIE
jgi:hypothetical protein